MPEAGSESGDPKDKSYLNSIIQAKEDELWDLSKRLLHAPDPNREVITHADTDLLDLKLEEINTLLREAHLAAHKNLADFFVEMDDRKSRASKQ